MSLPENNHESEFKFEIMSFSILTLNVKSAMGLNIATSTFILLFEIVQISIFLLYFNHTEIQPISTQNTPHTQFSSYERDG